MGWGGREGGGGNSFLLTVFAHLINSISSSSQAVKCKLYGLPKLDVSTSIPFESVR